jgi:hypothetical protein
MRPVDKGYKTGTARNRTSPFQPKNVAKADAMMDFY